MSKTGWTLAQAEEAKAAGEIMCASLRKCQEGWHIELHEWDGFRGTVEDEEMQSLCFATADLAIQTMATIGFGCEQFLYPNKPCSTSYVGEVEGFKFIVALDGHVRPAIEKTSIHML